MAIVSKQLTGAQATPRVKSSSRDIGNNISNFFAETPDAYASQAINEVFDFGIIPKGCRILPTGLIQCAAGAASSTLNIGLKAASDGTVIDADGIGKLVNLTAAGVKDANNGDFFLTGNGYVTTQDVVVYGTFVGAANTANQKISINLQYVNGH